MGTADRAVLRPAELKRWSTRGYSSVGRASALQAGGQRFEPAYLHQPHHAAVTYAPFDISERREALCVVPRGARGTPAVVAQRQSSRLVIGRLWVRVPPTAPRGDAHTPPHDSPPDDGSERRAPAGGRYRLPSAIRWCSSMVEHLPSKQAVRVRFPSLAPWGYSRRPRSIFPSSFLFLAARKDEKCRVGVPPSSDSVRKHRGVAKR